MIRLALAASTLALLWLLTSPPPVAIRAQQGPSAPFSGAKAAPVADWTGRINAGFYTVNCGAWGFQKGCQHWGVDIAGDGEGTPVYAPFGGRLRRCQDNGDGGPLIGRWIEYTDDHGGELLINHFRDLGAWCEMPPGTRIEAGALLGTMRGDANHVHMQVIAGGELVDFERYFEEY
jgi:murein DD-endopeptidase MepM/ murein hydrolase activator NlpD